MNASQILGQQEIEGRIYGRTARRFGNASFVRVEDDGSATIFGMEKKTKSGFMVFVDRADLEPAGTPVDAYRIKDDYVKTEKQAIEAAARLYDELGAEIGAGA